MYIDPYIPVENEPMGPAYNRSNFDGSVEGIKVYPSIQDAPSPIDTISIYLSKQISSRLAEGLFAKNLMSSTVVFTREDTLIMRVLSRMIVRNVDQLPVLSPDDRVIGVITKGDIFYTLLRTHLVPKSAKKEPKLSAKDKRSRSGS